jgi:hypothetical protein
VKKVTGFYPRSKVTPTSTRRRCSIPSAPHVYGGRTAIALQTSERHPALVPTC